MTTTFTERVLLIQRISDGRFWAPEVTFATTTPGWAENPAQAKRIKPYNLQELEKPEIPAYYEENSARMRHWLEGTRMVVAEIVTNVTIK